MTSDTPAPVMAPARALGNQWTSLPAWVPIPGLGMLANNTFVHTGREPMLVDTGMGMFGDAFVEALAGVVDPADLRWIWISHTDPDHTGNLQRILDLAPRARVLVGLLGHAKMELAGMDVSRNQLVMPGDQLTLGDRRLRAVRPPIYDAPETLGFIDDAGTMYTVDSFGAVLPDITPDLDDVDEITLRNGMAAWGALDAPWQADLDPALRERRFGAVEKLSPSLLLTAHLPTSTRPGQRLATAALAAASRLPADMAALDAAVLAHAARQLDEMVHAPA